MSDRDPPPHDLDAEGAILSGLLESPKAVRLSSLQFLEPEHFYSEANATVFRAMKALEAKSPNWDAVSVVGVLKDWHRLERCGGTPYVIGLLRDGQPVVIPPTARRHAARVVTLWRRRVAQRAFSTAAVAIATENPADVFSALLKELDDAGITLRQERPGARVRDEAGRVPRQEPDDVRGGVATRADVGVPELLREAHPAPEGSPGSSAKAQNAPPSKVESVRTRVGAPGPKAAVTVPAATRSADRDSSPGTVRRLRETPSGTASTAVSRPGAKPSERARA